MDVCTPKVDMDASSHLSDDACYLLLRKAQNAALLDYHMFDAMISVKNFKDIMLEHPNLRCRALQEKAEDEVRYDPNGWTHYRKSQQSTSEPLRTFVAVPDLSKGRCLPGIESTITQGVESGLNYGMHRKSLTEVSYDRFAPEPTACNRIIAVSSEMPIDSRAATKRLNAGEAQLRSW
jgi:hypothetical protein